jgi:hypothetical protein
MLRSVSINIESQTRLRQVNAVYTWLFGARRKGTRGAPASTAARRRHILVVRNEGNCVGSEAIAKTSIIAYVRRPVDVGGPGSDARVWRQKMIPAEMPRNPPGGSSNYLSPAAN